MTLAAIISIAWRHIRKIIGVAIAPDGGTMTEQEPLTIEELKEMAGQPVWCPDEEAYGIVMCDSIGQWAGVPFLHGVWYHDGIGVEFNHNIIGRKLKCYRVIDKREVLI